MHPPLPERPEVVVFDCDGVLVDSEHLANTVLARLLTEEGFPLSTERSVELFTGSTMAALYAWVEEQLGRALPPDFAQRVDDETFAAFETQLTALPAAAEVLAALRVPWCIATSGAPAKYERTLRTTGLWELARGKVIHAGEVLRGKPAPDLFLLAAARHQAIPLHCVVIEDTPRGIEGARAAGMPVLAFTGGSHMHPAQRARLLESGAPELTDLAGLRRLLPGAFA
jgi:HAD superfamily hydrolase (TIGR01509 family)